MNEIPIDNTADDTSENPGKSSLKTIFRIKKERYHWIDQGRGMVMFLLVVSGLMPDLLRTGNPISAFFFEHPSTTAPYMDLYDVGVPAFFFIIGLLMAVSFKNRIKKKGTWNAVLNELIRWGLIFATWEIILFFTGDGFGKIKQISPGVYWYVVSWDVVNALGFCGMLAIPFLFLSNKTRFYIAYGMIAFYQVMISVPDTMWRQYAIASVHGGFLGAIFVLTPIVLIGSCVGEYYVLGTERTKREKDKRLVILCLVNLAIGLVLWLIPGGFPNKRQSTAGYATISMAVVIAGLLAFVYTDWKDEHYASLNKVNKGRIVLFNAYGQNPFLIFILGEIFGGGFGAIYGDLDLYLQVIVWLAGVLVISIVALVLYKKGKIISTTKIALFIVILLVTVGLILYPLGIFNMF
ncbi:MAG TPA: hypothetical protein VKM55_27510 [Candidatus Lokiarchaeia archaeon]|nr:hypothetical protein [Candidatus Lokiarchaeia archaeon]